MNSSSDTLTPGQQPASVSKPLWAAVGVLGVAVLAMGGTMIYQMRTPTTPAVPVAQMASAAPLASLPAPGSVADDLIEKPAVAAVKPEAAPAKKVVKSTPKPAPIPASSYSGALPAPSTYPSTSPSSLPSPLPVAAAPVCTSCGSIESVTPVTRTTKAPGVGVGTVAGGVLGAVLGNQVGRGNGKTLGTIIGAVGGGFAGNAIEGQMRKETVYQVGVRMEDGSRRTVEVAQPPSVGSRVTVEGSSIRTNDGAIYRAPAAVVPNAVQSAPIYQN